MSTAKKESPRGQNWILTIYPDSNNIRDLSLCITDWTSTGKITGLVVQEEICPTTQKLHYQAYVKFNNSVRLAQVKSIFGSGVHGELRKGTEMEAIAYCSKLETRKPGTEPFFFGKMNEQGFRTDLEILKDEILDGKITVDDIVLSNPMIYHQYGRTFNKIEDIAMRRKFRTEMTKGIWLHGKTGKGKSHRSFQDFNWDTHYVWKLNDHGWQDGYTQQETVLINDFRGEIKFGELLLLVDKWPHTVPRRGREPMPFISKTVIVSSAKHPKDIYMHATDNQDSLDQLLRRFEIIEII